MVKPRPRNYPNPALLVLLPAIAFGAFAFVKYSTTTKSSSSLSSADQAQERELSVRNWCKNLDSPISLVSINWRGSSRSTTTIDAGRPEAGDLLRAEQNREGSQYGELIRQNIREGKIVPSEVTVGLLRNAIAAELEKRKENTEQGWGDGKGRFLVDGFPRQMDQAHIFDEQVCESKFVLFFVTSEEVLLQRLLERGKTSGREDDNEESIKKRFKTFVETSMPVVEYYKKHDKVIEIDATKSIDDVYTHTSAAVRERLSI
ncbi:UMP-CMP kinase {ECO:0000255/HAMAP-Rule:MF_03172} {ECO:0000255/HAMAP-Rule:MF_03172}; AltName: Full=Deoxycytidylate kinase {ECO:0000255/HAMAP-Rule:MF_03172}; Short=CK {ECO:0000255/HAMAP-Rule:MF_03172}; Short=dCMP kinase {ECO:0000255/HAMAP-Rule:MF_03172}; AltName: Full=Uridine monophosphate/cytidine monophosphate kinase {ECO:0000255/HAMAP-Rule:MF_03172}; Short=UMP/CMP kinase {ECO:0000255/HAMAP-Rule:MF_03172}; Short=UMP/CMPK {ECO:0000255/HAMAP-Rule:MF_03172} [Serendipita indica DSM 11827]|nr:UMP-CMP kinase {ECO:0000255/HAMAP-Rule:MF_03172} {ECO:0000255/HAMAP-Rule:MF_03172}; AltName: Full=Deoxycytidylate kinase {ECO:0000255/HAMAP-Rule:MF_03172}; Short=CK {ECO:0000255/HAMAP-Rule:MF_03172}; Short=dCMP kinase {ECO:0000255/HAMAP-Rule:MF_03172}; AltName: Full=Uridine monophosphate/cytidine monophosphate kinase {ECO:0000255/HAMAP-Rule:MF_03172}; Short=UMP/CMP kinase {ECO:0000255/HAMAP-Rule:MF_03172}; Short=UMP/CMPK {ECO:0000255/HAMAP-Rule:MF_03172} [Serendipita indica DSM 11827]